MMLGAIDSRCGLGGNACGKHHDEQKRGYVSRHGYNLLPDAANATPVTALGVESL